MEARPAYRATVMKDVLAALLDGPTAERDAVLRLLAPEVRETIESSSRIAWIDADMVADLTLSMHRALGDEDLERFWHDFTVAASTGSFFGQMHAAGLRMFGVKPSGFMRNFALAHRMTTRDMGAAETSMDNEARTGIITYSDTPSRYLTEGFALSNRGSMRAMFTMMNMSAQATYDLTAITKGRIRYTVTW